MIELVIERLKVSLDVSEFNDPSLWIQHSGDVNFDFVGMACNREHLWCYGTLGNRWAASIRRRLKYVEQRSPDI